MKEERGFRLFIRMQAKNENITKHRALIKSATESEGSVYSDDREKTESF